MAMDLQATCEILKATQLTEGAARKAAEQQLDKAASDSPNQLVAALQAVLQAAGNVEAQYRQEAAIILRQLVVGMPGHESAWKNLELGTRKSLMAQLLATVESDPSQPARRNVGQVASAVVTQIVEDSDADDGFAELAKEWPEFFPTLYRLVGPGSDPATRVVALNILSDVSGTICDGLIEKGGDQAVAMLLGALGDQVPEVRAAGAKLVLVLIEKVDIPKPLAPTMPAFIVVLQGFANDKREDQLKETLTALTEAIDAEAEFFKETCFQELWMTLVKLCETKSGDFGDDEVRTQAMQCLMSFVEELSEEFQNSDCAEQLELVVRQNVLFMNEVEENVDEWTSAGREDDEDECDGDCVTVGEENLDRLAEHIEDEVLMPALFKVTRALLASPDATWKHMRSAIMAISQVVEHIEDEAWLEQCVEFVMQHAKHAHPRVRYAVFWAIAQISYDQADSVSSKQEELLKIILEGIDDENIRVATTAVSAFTAMGDDIDYCDVEDDFVKELLQGLIKRLQKKESRVMQENCLSAVASIAEEAVEDQFSNFYGDVMPLIKQVIVNANKEDEKRLRGKAFECVSVIGQAVGKDMFLADAHETMAAMIKIIQGGFAADDEQKESIDTAAGRIAVVLGKDFKPYIFSLLPDIFKTLEQRPKEITESELPNVDDDDAPEMSFEIVGGKYYGLKTSILTDMTNAIDLLNKFIKASEETFCEFLPGTCEKLLPLLDMSLSDEDLLESTYTALELLTESARFAAEKGCLDAGVLRNLVTEFLKKIVIAKLAAESDLTDHAVLSSLLAASAGAAGVVKSAGPGALTPDVLKDVVGVVVALLARAASACQKDDEVPAKRRRGLEGNTGDDDDDEDEEEEEEPTAQALRFRLADVLGALMRAYPEAFTEVALRGYMELVRALLQNESSDCDRALAFYIVDEAVECLGEKTVPYWNWFMNQALQGVQDKSAVVRQYATSTLGNSASQAMFAQMAPAAAAAVYAVLQKHGERHKRRRAVKADSKQTALSIDAAIRTLGQIAAEQEKELGTHAEVAWNMWLSSLPMKYDVEAGKKAHVQLMALVGRGHPAMASAERHRRVVQILVDVYKTKFSTSELDAAIVAAVASIGSEEQRKQLCAGFPEKTQKKVEQIAKNAAKNAGS